MENTIIDKEVIWDKNTTLMSKTDIYGTIEYANEAFVNVSGYNTSELMAKPHNLIRHPDMPKIIFKLLWENINKGNSFHGIVKNKAKSGRYYWVITDFECVKDANNKITNFIGKRKAVSQEIIMNQIEPLYKTLLEVEKTSGTEASEKYLIGFLEEKGLSYVDYITKIMIEDHLAKNPIATEEKKQENKEEKQKGFFKRLFGVS